MIREILEASPAETPLPGDTKSPGRICISNCDGHGEHAYDCVGQQCNTSYRIVYISNAPIEMNLIESLKCLAFKNNTDSTEINDINPSNLIKK